MKSDAQVSIGVGAEVKSPGSGPRGFKSSGGRELAAAQVCFQSGFTLAGNRNRSGIFALSHFRTKVRIPLFLKML
jgi:hypothetical protein